MLTMKQNDLTVHYVSLFMQYRITPLPLTTLSYPHIRLNKNGAADIRRLKCQRGTSPWNAVVEIPAE